MLVIGLLIEMVMKFRIQMKMFTKVTSGHLVDLGNLLLYVFGMNT